MMIVTVLFSLQVCFYASAFVAFYAVHGVLRERKYELYVQVLAILIILVYCIAEYAKNVKGHNDVKLVSFV